MILSRFANAIRKQNWSTVVLELAILVIGVFVGLQVDDWNQQRLERESDRRALGLFVDELQLMIEDAEVDDRQVNKFLEELMLGTEIALNCDASEEERARLATAISNTLEWRVPDVRPSGLAEIGNSGTLARLGNPELTRAVGSIHQSIKIIDDSMIFIAPQYDRAWQMLLPYLVLKKPVSLEKTVMFDVRANSQYMSLAPQETLCRNQDFLLGLAMLTEFYGSSVFNFGLWTGALTTAYELAQAELP